MLRNNGICKEKTRTSFKDKNEKPNHTEHDLILIV